MRGRFESDDPEVAAERRERDRHAGRDDDGKAPRKPHADAVVEEWPCRCGVLVGVTQYAIEIWEQCNGMLAKQRKPPLTRTMPCAACKRADDELQAAEREAKRVARRPQEQTNLDGTTPTTNTRRPR
jgi:hypothetical protein